MFEYIFLGICILFCSVFIFLGAYLIKTINSKVKNCTMKITGQIVDYEKKQKYDNDSSHRHHYYVYRPKVKCYLAGLEVIKTLNTGHCSSDSEYPSDICHIGKEIDVFFNPNDYDDYYTLDDMTSKTVGIVMICIGVFAILFVSVFFCIPLLFNDIFVKLFVM